MFFDLTGHREERWRNMLQFLDTSLFRGVFLEDVGVLDFVVKTRIIDPNQDVVDAKEIPE